MKDFRDLKVWDKAHKLTLEIYQATRDFPKNEMYGLMSQTRRAGVSVAVNIAEGCGRADGDFGRFLQIAMGSASELEYLVLLSQHLSLLSEEAGQRLSEQVVEVKKMLAGLLLKLNPES